MCVVWGGRHFALHVSEFSSTARNFAALRLHVYVTSRCLAKQGVLSY